MKKKILGLGIRTYPYNNHGNFIEEISYRNHSSLLDADILLISPSLSAYDYTCHEFFEGKPSLDSDASGRFKDDLNYWKREVDNAIKAGITIFFIGNKPNDFFYKTGERDLSQRGKNISYVDSFNSCEICQIFMHPLVNRYVLSVIIL